MSPDMVPRMQDTLARAQRFEADAVRERRWWALVCAGVVLLLLAFAVLPLLVVWAVAT